MHTEKQYEFTPCELNSGSQVWYLFPINGNLVHQVNGDDITELECMPSTFNEAHRPIELAQWMLDKLGFYETEDGGIYSEYTSACFAYRLLSDINGFWYYGGTGTGHQLKYWHEFQRLHYFLNGQWSLLKEEDFPKPESKTPIKNDIDDLPF